MTRISEHSPAQCCEAAAANPSVKSAPGAIVDQYRPDLEPFEQIYREIHQNPELSGNEDETAARVSERLRSLDLAVEEGIGGCGVVGILRNGEGPKVMLRSELDALPIEEETDLPFASKKRMRDRLDGKTKPVMHACGHDIHIASLLAVATLLKSAKSEWKGTLICVFQPSEELLNGAQAMVDDGLFDRIPKPDVILGQHVAKFKTGTLSVGDGPILAAADTFDVRIFGRGGHGATPANCIDPIVIASHVVVRLQTVVSRETPPGKTAIITCGSLHAGEAANVIPDYADLKVDLRTLDTSTRKQCLAALKRTIYSECDASAVEKQPSLERTRECPILINDESATLTIQKGFKQYFGDNLLPMDPIAASDDFAVYRAHSGIPSVYWFLGGTDAAKWDDAVKKDKVKEMIPGGHTSKFSPVIEPTLRTGVDALAIAALLFFAQHRAA